MLRTRGYALSSHTRRASRGTVQPWTVRFKAPRIKITYVNTKSCLDTLEREQYEGDYDCELPDHYR
jgi:hypothetical protein